MRNIVYSSYMSVVFRKCGKNILITYPVYMLKGGKNINLGENVFYWEKYSFNCVDWI